jgi:hypothetical protein
MGRCAQVRLSRVLACQAACWLWKRSIKAGIVGGPRAWCASRIDGEMAMSRYSDLTSVTAGIVATTLLFSATQGLAQSSSGVAGHTPPPSVKRLPTSGPGLSRLPLVDPEVVPPGVSDPSQEAPLGEPGSAPAAPGHTGEGANR